MRCNRRPDSFAFRPSVRRGNSAAFTLVELLVCLAVVAILTGLLLPALKHVREASQRIRCASNMHQIGFAISTYTQLYSDHMPPSVHAEPEHRNPQELMVATRGPADASIVAAPVWDGLGWLVHGKFINPSECLYCPSHHGEHPFERYAVAYDTPAEIRVYTNYHYAGHVKADGRRQMLSEGHDLLLLTDGLRTQSDFNHRNGTNRLFADMSTDWWFDAGSALRESLPVYPLPPSEQSGWFDAAWTELGKPSTN